MSFSLENLGGDRLAIRGELEKLFLYLGDQKIVTVDAVEAIVGDTTAAKTDHAIDAALLGENEALEMALSRMRADGSSASALGALALRHLLQLQTLRAAVDAGESPSRAVDFARPPIFNRRRPTVEAELKRWPSDAIAEARRRIDRAVMQMRLEPALEDAAISEALHEIALTARRLKQAAPELAGAPSAGACGTPCRIAQGFDIRYEFRRDRFPRAGARP